MSEQYSTFIIRDSSLDKTDKFSNDNSIIKEEIKIEPDDKNTGIQNSILIIEDNYVKEEIDMKEEILTYLIDDDNVETCTENIAVKNNISNNITIDTLNVCVEIKTKK